MTKDEGQILKQHLATAMQSLGDIAALLNDCYGSKDPRVVRAEEAQGAVQRLLWALERRGLSLTIAGGAQVREIVQIAVKAQQ